MSTGSIYFLDTFSTDQFSSGYREFHDPPHPDDKYNLTRGWLRIEAGPRQDLWDGGSKKGAPLLLRLAPEGDYRVETFVSADRIGEPSQPINTQIGLFVFQDVDNWLFFGLTHHNFTLADGPHLGDGLMVTKTEGGNSSPMPIEGAYADPAYPTHHLTQDSLYLRISREGDDWKFYWKLHHDDTWDLLTTVNLALGDHEVGMGVKTFDLDLDPPAELGPGQANFDFFLIGRGPTRRNRMAFQYAVKFICGTSHGEVVAPGEYWTAINVHNPTPAKIGFRKKVAIALPGEQAGPISSFDDARLGPDEALEIDCKDILEHVEYKDEFLKGFVVIQSDVELDVVAVYTAAGRDKQVETLHTERVRPRRLEVGLPDLIPVPDEHGNFCRLKDGRLIVSVKNQGTTGAGPSATEVDFYAHGKVVKPTQPLAPGASVDLVFPIPLGCFDPDCAFKITVDVNNDVAESDEGNNVATGICIG